MISRIRAVLRRIKPAREEAKKDVSIGNLYIDISNYIVKVDDRKIDMPPKEIELLYYLATHPMRVFTREQLLKGVWDSDYKGDTRTVDVHIKRIREKLGEGKNWSLETVWRVGYKFEVTQ